MGILPTWPNLPNKGLINSKKKLPNNQGLLIHTWRLPEMEVPPVVIHFSRIFHEIKHPAIGVPPFQEDPIYG